LLVFVAILHGMTRTWPAIDIAPLDDLVQAALLEYEVAAIDEDAARVFFQSADVRDRAAASLHQQFPALAITSIDVADEDWAARSQASLSAVRVGNIIVAPPWDVPADSPDSPELTSVITHHTGASRDIESHVGPNFSSAIVIVIQPSMGFGTGHHATTRLCIAHLQRLDLRGRTALDVGTGSGVLAIAASRLGASQVLAIDDDPDAIASARENLELNHGTNVTLGTLDLRRAVVRPFGVVLANLTGGLLVATAEVLMRMTAPGGRLILSGFMQSEEPDVLAAFASCTIDQRSQEDEWVCATFSR
jgi:ribosomal protein L11 methyltransferase